jgi:hypothetical protein
VLRGIQPEQLGALGAAVQASGLSQQKIRNMRGNNDIRMAYPKPATGSAAVQP